MSSDLLREFEEITKIAEELKGTYKYKVANASYSQIKKEHLTNIYINTKILEIVKEFYKEVTSFKEVSIPLLADLKEWFNNRRIVLNDIYLEDKISNSLLDTPSPLDVTKAVYTNAKICIGNLHTHPNGVPYFSTMDMITYLKWPSYLPIITEKNRLPKWLKKRIAKSQKAKEFTNAFELSGLVNTYYIVPVNYFIGLVWEFPFDKEIQVVAFLKDEKGRYSILKNPILIKFTHKI